MQTTPVNNHETIYSRVQTEAHGIKGTNPEGSYANGHFDFDINLDTSSRTISRISSYSLSVQYVYGCKYKITHSVKKVVKIHV